MEWRDGIKCECGNGQYIIYNIGVAATEKIMINLEATFAAKCINCGGEWLMDGTKKGGARMIRLFSEESRNRITEIKVNQYDTPIKVDQLRAEKRAQKE